MLINAPKISIKAKKDLTNYIKKHIISYKNNILTASR